MGAFHAPAPGAHKDGRQRPWRRISLGTGIVGLVAGLMFAANASIFADDGLRQPQDLQGLARAEADRLERLEEENAELRADIAPYLEDETGDAGADLAADSPPAAAVGLDAVEGPGVEVRLWDAPHGDGSPAGFAPDDLVVHQQDLEAVMNALWSGGAEAMAVQGHRVVSTTGVRCVGNVLHIAGRSYSPPYVIEAVGDPDALEAALRASPGVGVYLQYVDAVGLGWSETRQTDLHLPAYSGTMALKHAEVLEDA